jgi:hypothetical protein
MPKKLHETIILPVVLNGCKMWFLNFEEEYKLQEYENKGLRKTGGKEG